MTSIKKIKNVYLPILKKGIKSAIQEKKDILRKKDIIISQLKLYLPKNEVEIQNNLTNIENLLHELAFLIENREIVLIKRLKRGINNFQKIHTIIHSKTQDKEIHKDIDIIIIIINNSKNFMKIAEKLSREMLKWCKKIKIDSFFSRRSNARKVIQKIIEILGEENDLTSLIDQSTLKELQSIDTALKRIKKSRSDWAGFIDEWVDCCWEFMYGSNPFKNE